MRPLYLPPQSGWLEREARDSLRQQAAEAVAIVVTALACTSIVAMAIIAYIAING